MKTFDDQALKAGISTSQGNVASARVLPLAQTHTVSDLATLLDMTMPAVRSKMWNMCTSFAKRDGRIGHDVKDELDRAGLAGKELTWPFSLWTTWLLQSRQGRLHGRARNRPERGDWRAPASTHHPPAQQRIYCWRLTPQWHCTLDVKADATTRSLSWTNKAGTTQCTMACSKAYVCGLR